MPSEPLVFDISKISDAISKAFKAEPPEYSIPEPPDELYKMLEYLPEEFLDESEEKYIDALILAAQTSYENGLYQFAYVQYHMLFMTAVYYVLLKVSALYPDEFEKALFYLLKDRLTGFPEFDKMEKNRGLQVAPAPKVYEKRRKYCTETEFRERDRIWDMEDSKARGRLPRSVGAVIFDLDGTLTDTEKYFQVSWRQAAKHFGYLLDPERALQLRSLGRPFAEKQFKAWFGADAPFHEIRAYRQQLFNTMAEEEGVLLKPGAIELLVWLKQAGITTALATSGNTDRAEQYLQKTGVRPYIDEITCADMVDFGKPAPDTYLSACRKLGVKPESALAVEDSPNGIKSAFSSGCCVVMVPDLTEPDEEILPMLSARFDTLSDIKTCLSEQTCSRERDGK